ncbi:MAG: hypothetical protein JSS75_03855 [Bacteroidetes bacterium]|nr:hypothetical protein [Bacteroidota bacterium]
MRQLLFLALIATTPILLNSCTVNKDFSFGLDREFVVNNYSSTTYSRSDTADANKASSDFTKYKSDMQSLEIERATYTITSFSGSATQTIVSGSLAVSDIRGGTSITLASISNVNLSSVAAMTQELPLSDAGKQFFKDQLLGSAGAAILTFSATTNETPITFTVRFHFDIKATYEKSFP